MSERGDLMRALREEWQAVRADAYFVKRGAINWVTFPFVDHPRAVALMMDEGYLYGQQSMAGFIPGTVTFEVATRMSDPEGGIDDDRMGEILEDAKRVLREVQRRTNRDGDPLLLRVVPKTARFIEFHDSEHAVEGAIITVEVAY